MASEGMKNRYLKFDAGQDGTGIRDEFSGYIDLKELHISGDLIREITQWVAEYPSAPYESSNLTPSEISKHDDLGISLMKRTAIELGDGYKFKYFSDITSMEYLLMDNGSIKKYS